MKKGISPIISTVMLILIMISAAYIVIEVAKPTLDRAHDSAVMNEANQNMQLLDNLIREVASEGTGSLRSVVLKVSDGEYRVINKSGNFTGAIQFKIGLKYSPFSAPMFKKVGNLKYAVGMNAIGLVGYWNFDEGSGSTAYDYSGNENNGTYYGYNPHTQSNSTVLQLTGFSPINLTHYLDLPSKAILSDVNLTVYYKNNTPSLGYNTIKVFVNDNYIGSFNDSGETSQQSYAFINILKENFTASSLNTITYEGNVSNITQSTLKYVQDIGWVDGKFDKAIKFDGVDDYIDISDADSLDLSSEFTIEAWINPATVNVFWNLILHKGAGVSAGQYAYYLRLTNNKITFTISNDTAADELSGTKTYNVNSWYHVVAVSSSTALTVYQNGVFDKNMSRTVIPLNSASSLKVGRGYNYFFNGIIDEVRIYNRALREEEIKENFDAKASNYQVVLDYSKIIITGNLRLGKGTHKVCIEKVGDLENKPWIRIAAC
jgi:flagellin-like protein